MCVKDEFQYSSAFAALKVNQRKASAGAGADIKSNPSAV